MLTDRPRAPRPRRTFRQRCAADLERCSQAWLDWFDGKGLPTEWEFLREDNDYLSERLRAFLVLSTLDEPVSDGDEPTTNRIASFSEEDRARPVTPYWWDILGRLLAPRNISRQALPIRNYNGRYAIENYVRWLEGKGPRWNDELLNRRAGPLLGIERGRRWEVYRRILRFLGPGPGKPVLIVYEEAMQDGMTALAGSLCDYLKESAKKDEISFVYLPLRPHGPPGARERVTLPMLVAWLKAFYQGMSLAAAKVPDDPQTVRADIAEIRRVMTERPAVIILDGHRSPGWRLPYLHAAMIDDPLLPLLEDLIHPRHAAGLPPPNPEVVERSRILVLSDQNIHHHNAFRRQSEPFPLPTGGTLVKLLEQLGVPLPKPSLDVLKLARSCCSDVGLRLFSRMAAQVPADQLPTSIERLYAEYLARLEREDAGALAVLYLIGLTYDGLRADTLRLLLDQMVACHAQQPLQMPFDMLEQVDVGAALRRLADDGVIEAIIETNPPDTIGWTAGDHVVHDVVASGLRQAVVTRLADDREGLSLAHRLVAEEALRQHTDQLARSDWLDRFNIRSHRRLYQFFYHAYLSLGDGPEGRIARLDAVPHVLPAANEETFRRLYAVFFRTLTEGPPVLELSRVFGRDGLKADLIVLALCAGAPGLAKDVLDRSKAWGPVGPGPFATRYNWSRHTPEDAVQAMVADMRVSLARAEFSLRRPASVIVPDVSRPDGTQGVALPVKLGLDLELENATDEGQYRSIMNQTREALMEAGLTLRQQENIDRLALIVAQDDFVPRVDEMVRGYARSRPDPARLAAWSDLLCRLGEARQLLAGLGGDAIETVPNLTEAFVCFFVAEKLRRASFDIGPLGSEYVVNGRSTRVFVRICLQLLMARRVVGSGPIPEPLLVEQADRHIGIITRYFARLPSESAAIHVLRAQRERIVGYPDYAALEKARRWLELADEAMWYGRDRQTVRLMLLVERCAVYRGLARATTAEVRARFRAAAIADAEHLRWMAGKIASGIWTRATTRTFDRLTQLEADLGMGSGAQRNGKPM